MCFSEIESELDAEPWTSKQEDYRPEEMDLRVLRELREPAPGACHMGRVNVHTRGKTQDRHGRDSDKDGRDISRRPE